MFDTNQVDNDGCSLFNRVGGLEVITSGDKAEEPSDDGFKGLNLNESSINPSESLNPDHNLVFTTLKWRFICDMLPTCKKRSSIGLSEC